MLGYVYGRICSKKGASRCRPEDIKQIHGIYLDVMKQQPKIINYFCNNNDFKKIEIINKFEIVLFLLENDIAFNIFSNKFTKHKLGSYNRKNLSLFVDIIYQCALSYIREYIREQSIKSISICSDGWRY